MFSRKHHFRRLDDFSQVTNTSTEDEEDEGSTPLSHQWFYSQRVSYLSCIQLLVLLLLSFVVLAPLGYVINIRMGEQSTSLHVFVSPPLSFVPAPTVTGRRDAYKFIILQMADIHLGEAPGEWGPTQDVKTWRAMNTILSLTRPDLIIFSGDQITANDIKDNATTYYKMLGDFIESYHIPWGIIFGNHDDANFLNTSMTTSKRSDLLKFLQQQDYKYSVTRQDSSPTNVFGVSNYVLNVTLPLRDSVVTMAAQIILLDSGGGTLPNQLQRSQLDWISSIRVRDIPAVVFQHIPTSHHSFQDKMCVGSNGDGGIDPVSYDPGILDFLLSDGAVHLLAVGHNHGNSYCCPATNGNETLPLTLCFGRHSGYGGYGDFARGSRMYELNIKVSASPEDAEKPKFTLRSWVQMESGNVTELYTPQDFVRRVAQ